MKTGRWLIASLTAIIMTVTGAYQSARADGIGQLVTAKGTISVFDGVNTPFTLEFNPAGGNASGGIPQVTRRDSESVEVGSITYTGTFSGGDGGSVQGTCKVRYECTYTAPDENGFGNMACQLIKLAKEACDCRWQGRLYADGHGEGTSGCANPGAGGTTQGNVSGNWRVTFPKGLITGKGAEPAQPADEVPEELPPMEEIPPEETVDENSQPENISRQEIREAIAAVRANAQSGYTRASAGQLITWNGTLVSVHVDPSDRPFFEDLNGNRFNVDENGNPLEEGYEVESPSREVISSHPGVDWNSKVAGFVDRVTPVINSIGLPDWELVRGTFGSPQSSSLYEQIQESVNLPDNLGISELTDSESRTVQVEIYSLQNRGAMQNAAAASKSLISRVLEETASSSAQSLRTDIARAVVTVGGEKPELPAGVTREFYDRVIHVIGQDKLEELIKETGMDPEAAADLEKKLRALGVRDEKELARTINAVQAIRVLGNMAKDHTVGTSGAFDKIFTFIDRWTAHRAATEAVINDPELNLSKEQLDMIQKSINELGVFEEGEENFAVNQFMQHIKELIEDQMEGE